MRVEIRVPDTISPKGGDAAISQWHLSKGDRVVKGEPIVELIDEDKIFDVPAPATGTIARILVQDGKIVKTGELLAVIEGDG